MHAWFPRFEQKSYIYWVVELEINVPDSMSRSTWEFCDINIHRSFYYRYAIITCSDRAAFNADVLGACNVNSVSIWASLRGSYDKTWNLHIVALFDGNMDLLAVFNIQLVHVQVIARVESKRLYVYCMMWIKPYNYRIRPPAGMFMYIDKYRGCNRAVLQQDKTQSRS